MGEWVERNRAVIALILVILTVGGAAAFLARRPDTRPIEIVTPTRVARATAQPVKVYVTGEVVSPGVYAMAENDRIEDAIRLAGGPTSDADLVRVNLAAKVHDQLQINVPRKVEGSSRQAEIPISNPSAPSKININAATSVELESLPGIGPVTSQKILAYRQEHGGFKSIEELKEAKIVNSSTFEKIKDLIVVR